MADITRDQILRYVAASPDLQAAIEDLQAQGMPEEEIDLMLKDAFLKHLQEKINPTESRQVRRARARRGIKQAKQRRGPSQEGGPSTDRQTWLGKLATALSLHG